MGLGLRLTGLGFFLETCLRRSTSRGFLFEPCLRHSMGRGLLRVGEEILPGLRVTKPQPAVFVVAHHEPERIAVQAEPAVDRGEARQRPVAVRYRFLEGEGLDSVRLRVTASRLTRWFSRADDGTGCTSVMLNPRIGKRHDGPTRSDTSMKRRLPIGIQTFREIREEGCYYVDKTAYIRRLLDEGKHYFLSRPRRFGKSLFLDTCKELFEGSEALFEGLAIHDSWDWSVRHPVVRLSFGKGNFKLPGYLHTNLMAQLDGVERDTGVKSAYATGPERLSHLVESLHRRAGQRVVVLIDEYDKPILDALDVPEVARANGDDLRGLYAVVKDSDAHIRFSFLTGVSKFSKVSLFSGLNNLTDITLDPRYSAICGYSDADLDTVFAPELPGLDRDAIREWYNGYGWLGEERVYNPFDILLLLRNRKFGAWWFETGTPAFLVETLFRRRVSSVVLDGMLGTDALLSAFDVDDIATEALLFQTGYLTIREETSLGGKALYRLGYPNREVRQSLNECLLEYLVRDASRRTTNSVRLAELLESNDFDGMKALFHAFFASIPYEWYTNNDIARYEGYYASVFYSYFAALGLDITVEDSTSHGRLDMAVRFNGNVYLFEFKVVEMAGEGAAMAQLEARGYAEKYRGAGEPIHLVAVEFSRDTRNVVAFEVETG